jgi:hypothetical protein
MANPTSNFGWQMPTNTDLVKDLPADFEVFGQAVDTSLMDLKGGTTGQVLSKASNTDMDFTWVTSDDANGDLISASAADVPARLAVGNNGETLVADSSTSTGLRWQGNFAAGKNKIINGDFNINQRAFTSVTTDQTFTFDRFFTGVADGTVTFTPQTFTPGTAPESGYESTNFLRIVTTGQTLSSAQARISQRIEDARTFAGQTVTVSFWAKASTGTPSVAINLSQTFGTGGSASVTVNGQKNAITTSWARYSKTFSIPSVSGKTIGAGSTLRLNIWTSAGSDNNTATDTLGIQSATIDIWGVQVEAGNVATAFQTATGTLAGELAACQRYYYRQNAPDAYSNFGTGFAVNTTTSRITISLPVTMRTKISTTVDSANLALYDGLSITALTSLTVAENNTQTPSLNAGVAAGLTANRPYSLIANNSTSAYVGVSAEL